MSLTLLLINPRLSSGLFAQSQELVALRPLMLTVKPSSPKGILVPTEIELVDNFSLFHEVNFLAKWLVGSFL